MIIEFPVETTHCAAEAELYVYTRVDKTARREANKYLVTSLMLSLLVFWIL